MGEAAARNAPLSDIEIHTVTVQDITGALKAGLSDFKRAPLMGLFFGGIYVLGGWLILGLLNAYGQPWMIIPLAIGFPLVGPFVAAGLYEISRRLSAGRSFTWGDILGVVLQQRQREFSWMAFVVLLIFWFWVYQVRLWLAIFLGSKSVGSVDNFVTVVTTTQEGMLFLMVGTVVGACLSLVLFSTTVIAMPTLLDRELDLISAMILSFQTVLKSPVVMLGWGLVIAALALAALLPAFLGLLVVLPVLGHATWHLYDRAIGGATAG